MTTQMLLEAAAVTRRAMAQATDEQKNAALFAMAAALRTQTENIFAANAEDLIAAAPTVSPVMLDRLRLTPERLEAMAAGMEAVAALPDPVGVVREERRRPNGLLIQKVSVPLGVIALIFESRPNVTSDAAALALKSGNVCVLRGGKEAIRSNKAIVAALRSGLAAAQLPEDAVCLIEDTDHRSAQELMNAVGLVDLLIPRGGAGLIRACVEQSRVPCIQTGSGICHLYIDDAADVTMALNIVENAKASRPSVCNAAEVCLVHRAIAPKFLPLLSRRLTTERAEKGLPPVELRLDEEAGRLITGTPAGAADFDTEFLNYILAVHIVGNVTEACEHIRRHSTGHSEVIVTANDAHAEQFLRSVDSAAVYVNASTRFTDGGEFGLGCEMGISTQKLHARGPMGLEELTSYQYRIRGNGQIR